MSLVRLLSSIAVAIFTFVSAATAHEVLPSIADVELEGDQLYFDVRLNIETFVAGIDQAATVDTDNTPEAIDYDALRALEPSALEAMFREFWPDMEKRITVTVDNEQRVLSLVDVTVEPVGNKDIPRDGHIRFSAEVSSDAQNLSVGWAKKFGVLILRQQGVSAPYDGYLEPGATSPVFSLTGGDQASGWQTFVRYIPVGFDHIVPKGLDHILFVLGLFFLSTKMRPLLWQISAFTLAHTITLALAALGYVSVPASIVEPLIAASIVYVAIENLFTDGLSPWRPFVIFGFGLLHGLGFASVLAEFGLPEGSFIPALIGFNIGVEIGQLAVVAVAFVCVMKAVRLSQSGAGSRLIAGFYLVAMVLAVGLLVPISNTDYFGDLLPLVGAIALLLGFSAASVVVGRYDSYREIVALPGSIMIAVIALYWSIERTLL